MSSYFDTTQMPFTSSRCTGSFSRIQRNRSCATPRTYRVGSRASDPNGGAGAVMVPPRRRAGPARAVHCEYRQRGARPDRDRDGRRRAASSRARLSSAARRPSGCGQVLDEDADHRVADRADDGRIVQTGRIGAEGAQPPGEGVAERVGGLEQRVEHVVVAVHRLGDQRPPEVLVGGHAHEDVVEAARRAGPRRCRPGPPGTARAGDRLPAGARSRPGGGRASTGSSGTASRR